MDGKEGKRIFMLFVLPATAVTNRNALHVIVLPCKGRGTSRMAGGWVLTPTIRLEPVKSLSSASSDRLLSVISMIL